MVREPASDQHMNAVHELFLLILYSVYVNWCFWWLRYQSSDAIVQTALRYQNCLPSHVGAIGSGGFFGILLARF